MSGYRGPSESSATRAARSGWDLRPVHGRRLGARAPTTAGLQTSSRRRAPGGRLPWNGPRVPG